MRDIFWWCEIREHKFLTIQFLKMYII